MDQASRLLERIAETVSPVRRATSPIVSVVAINLDLASAQRRSNLLFGTRATEILLAAWTAAAAAPAYVDAER